MAEQEERAARVRIPESSTGRKEEPQVAGEGRAYELPSQLAPATPRLGAFRMGPAAEASYGPPFVAAKSQRVVETTPSPAIIHGDDLREQVHDTTAYPYSAIADLWLTFGDGSTYGGTGWFIGPYTLLTAGHNVYSSDPNHSSFGWAASIEVMPGRNGDHLPFGSIMASNWDALYWWKNGGYPDYDCGVIVVDQPLGDNTGRFGLHAMSDEDLRATTATVCGYPGDKLDGTMWYDEEQVADVDPLNVYYTTDTEGAMSGSPVFYEFHDGTRYAIAVHNYGGFSANSGRRITDDVFEWALEWKHNPFG